MSYSFIIRHSLPGRTRIRWSGETDERGQVETLAPQIAELPGVDKTDARPHSGSIVIEHETIEWAELEPRLQTECGIAFADASAQSPTSGLDSFNHGVGYLDRELRKIDVDLNSLVFLFLLVMSVAQAARGQFGVSGFSFLWYALSVASHRRDSETAAVPPPGDKIRPI